MWSSDLASPLHEKKDDTDDLIYVGTGVRETELPDSSEHPVTYQYTVTGRVRKRDQCRPQLGIRKRFGETEIALFRWKSQVLAIDAVCPHKGVLTKALML